MNEFFTMTLADRVKLPVPRVYRRYVPEPVYIIERFDRNVDETGTRRRHIVDACQLLNKSRAFKTSARLDTLKEVVEACRNRAQARRHVFRWLVFCVLLGNDDNHLKNLSFLVDAEGIAVAPHFGFKGLVIPILGAVGSFLLGLALTATIAIVTGVRRGRHKKRLQAERAYS